jgi:beta-fructofuranosidase
VKRSTLIAINLHEQDLARYQELAASAREQFRDEAHRPTYHFTPPANWMNDPNSLIQWNGRCHLFYQHHPAGPYWADMHWGHAASDDLLRWHDLPIALAPTRDGYDRDGVYSGCAVDDDGVPTVVYTGVEGPIQSVCVATGDVELLRWTKDPANPVIPAPPSNLNLIQTADGTIHFRDPCVWREADRWQMVIGSGITDVGGAILRYSSSDLRDWTYEGPVLIDDVRSRNPIGTGTMWECPAFFPLGDRHVLIISVWDQETPNYLVAMVGHYHDGQFVPESTHLFDPGSHYAPQTFLDRQGRRILIGWLREQRDRASQIASGWSGAMTIPWQLTLDDRHRLHLAPVSELHSLRHTHRTISAKELPADRDTIFPNLTGDTLELDAVFEPGPASAVGLIVRRSLDGAEETRITYEPATQTLSVDRSRSRAEGLGDGWGQARYETHLQPDPGEALRLQVFLDRSVLEIVANERVMLSARIYPTRDNSLGIGAFASERSARLASLDCWGMRATM